MFLDKKQNLILAPMAGISDIPFRKISYDFGADIAVTEMINARGLIEGSKKTYSLMRIDEKEKNTGIQLFGNDMAIMQRAVEIVCESNLNAKFIDINAGCPAKKVIRSGSGGALLKDLKKLEIILNSVKSVSNIPISCKVRIGYSENNIDEIVDAVKSSGVRIITIHGRTVKQGFKGESNLSWIKYFNNDKDMQYIISGDINTPDKAVEIMDKFPESHIMIGRGTLGNPFIFNYIKDLKGSGKYNKVNKEELFKTIRRHYKFMLETFGDYGVILMRKHIGWYLKGLPGAKKLKDKINRLEEYSDVIKELDAYDRN